MTATHRTRNSGAHRGIQPVVRRLAPRRWRALVAALAALGSVVVFTGIAAAYFTSTGSGTGTATAGTLGAPTAVTGHQVSGTSTVTVSWTAPTGTTAPEGYYVLRYPGSGPSVAACGSSATSPVTGTSCADASVPVGTYTYVVVAVFRSWTGTSGPSAPVTVVETTQTITFTSSPANPVVGGSYLVTATGGASGNPVVFSAATPGVCTVTSGGSVSFVHVGTCTVNANQAGNAQYDAAPQAQQTFGVGKGSQTVAFSSVAPSTAVVGGTGYTPTASGGASGNPVTFSIDASTAGSCSISGGVVSYQHVGTCTVDADQAGSSDYLAANTVQQSYAIGKGSQAITFTSTAPTNATVNDTYTVTATGGASGSPVTFSSGSPSVCSVTTGGLVTFLAAGTCSILGDQAATADYLAAAQVTQQVTVAKRSQTISFTSPAPGAATFGGSYSAAATATSGLAVTFTTDTASVCTVSTSGAVSFVGVGTCHVVADQAGNATYAAAPQVQQSFSVAKASQTISFGALANKTFGNGPFSVSATASSGLAVTFGSATPSVCSVSGNTVTIVTAGTCTVNADQVGNANYLAAAQVQQTFTIAKANQTISFAALGGKTYGDPAFTVSATASSGLTVAFTSATTGTCTVSGSTVTIAAAGTCTINANQAGNGNYNAATQVQQSFTVAKANQTITFNQPTTPANAGSNATLVATASSGLTVTFTSATTSVCTVTGTRVDYNSAGTCTINADQAGNGNVNAAAQVSRSVTVNATDTSAPVISGVRPVTSSTAGAWLSLACNVSGTSGKPCATVTDNVGVSSVTMTLTKSNGRCWDGLTGSNFTNTGCPVSVSMVLTNGVYAPTNNLAHANGSANQNFTDDTYTLVITASDAAGNTSTATTTFKINN